MDIHHIESSHSPLEYSDPEILPYQRFKIVDSFIPEGYSLFDVGMVPGELISIKKIKIKGIYRINVEFNSMSTYREKCHGYSSIKLLHGNIQDFTDHCCEIWFDVISALDIFEHITVPNYKVALDCCYKMLKDNGVFIFSGPGTYERIRIHLNHLPTHVCYHSPIG